MDNQITIRNSIFSDLDNHDIDFNKQLILTLQDVSLYNSIQLCLVENDNGEYCYDEISNLGMLYMFIHDNSRPNRSERTKIEYIRELIQFFKWIQNLLRITDIRNLHRKDCDKYQLFIINKYKRQTTQQKKCVVVKSFLDWCYRKEYIKRNLTLGFYSIRIDKEQIPERDIQKSNITIALEKLNNQPKFKSLLLLLGTTGMRLNEVITPKWRDVYWDEKRKNVYLKTLTKGRKIRHVLLKEYVLHEIQEYRLRVGLQSELDPYDETPFFPNRYGRHYRLTSLSTSFSKKMAEIGLVTECGGRITPHFMRHFFAQEAYDAGASTDNIADTLQHSDPKITKSNYLKRQLQKEHDVSVFVDLNI
ncbi:site-specific integrase [Bacillus cereus]|uniref:tyrosine-type recombinase/integrase n=1 Tax=Paenibacillus melissococcoides TaxID=2912268 RepID=UPI0021C3C9FD|nr:site-specific integrase [Paenibacillus melissococcoides]MEB9897188.1 site-specific integrase [Bacillus cereus]CAH8721269.1 site-specific integrase [Paenibacillus melissococcoides]